MSRKRILGLLRWLSPFSWPEPRTDTGVYWQIAAASLLMPSGVLFLLWLGTPSG
jgi:hypothetical protein